MIKKYFFHEKVALGHEGKVSFVPRYKTISFLLWFWKLHLFCGKEIALGFWDSALYELHHPILDVRSLTYNAVKNGGKTTDHL